MPVIDTGTLVRPAFEAAQFTATKWDSAADKADFANALCRFIAAQTARPALLGPSRDGRREAPTTRPACSSRACRTAPGAARGLWPGFAGCALAPRGRG